MIDFLTPDCLCLGLIVGGVLADTSAFLMYPDEWVGLKGPRPVSSLKYTKQRSWGSSQGNAGRLKKDAALFFISRMFQGLQSRMRKNMACTPKPPESLKDVVVSCL